MHTIELIASALTKQFIQGTVPITVLNKISVSFKQGNTYAITGASGSGKSTLLHILAGVDTPTHGLVTFDKRDIHSMTTTQHAHFLTYSIGLIFQYPYLIQELSVIENVALKGLIAGIPYDQCLKQAYDLLKIVGLHDKAHTQPATLSGGQQQRVSIVRALFNKPAFLIADEPTGNLDELTAESVIHFIRDCQKEWNMGLIVSSHDPYIASLMSYTYHLHNGQITIQEKTSLHEGTTSHE